MLDFVIRSSKREDPEQAKYQQGGQERAVDAQATTTSNGSGSYGAAGPSPLELEKFKPL
jgi:hypothetical protein